MYECSEEYSPTSSVSRQFALAVMTILRGSLNTAYYEKEAAIVATIAAYHATTLALTTISAKMNCPTTAT